jgi:hypothetical protein
MSHSEHLAGFFCSSTARQVDLARSEVHRDVAQHRSTRPSAPRLVGAQRLGFTWLELRGSRLKYEAAAGASHMHDRAVRREEGP